MPKPPAGKRQLPTVLPPRTTRSIRLSPRELKEITEAAEQDGKCVGEWIRKVAVEVARWERQEETPG